MQAEGCAIFLKETGSDSLVCRYGAGLETNKMEAPLEGSMVGGVMGDGQSVIENDLLEKRGYHILVEEQPGFVSRNSLMCPRQE